MTISYKTQKQQIRTDRFRPYQNVSIIELAQLIVHDKDREALKELHDHRRLFRFRKGNSLLFAQFIESLCNSHWALSLACFDYNLLERTYDLMIDRFSNLPCDSKAAAIGADHGSDCRYYFQSFLVQMEKESTKNHEYNDFEREMLAVKILQDTVTRQFVYCCREAKRMQNPTRSRYKWVLPNGTLVVWMPVAISGNERRAWLDGHVNDPDPKRDGEQQRVQQIVDCELGTVCINSLEDLHELSAVELINNNNIPPSSGCQIDIKGLAETIVDEKAKNIHLLRPSIRVLGRTKLRKLIYKIFHEIIEGNYEEKKLADLFGLSQATFSRFAGSRWQVSVNVRPPDLWTNLAQALTTNKTLVETAEKCGIWQKVKQIIEISR